MTVTKTNVANNGDIAELIDFVRSNSPFYAEFWESTVASKDASVSLDNLPTVDHESFWQANTCLNSKVITSKQKDGIVFKTGGMSLLLIHISTSRSIRVGTTNHPKVSFYNQKELHGLSTQLAESLARCGVGEGDMVANLFYAGDLYGSFLLHILSVYYLPGGAIQLPVAGHVGISSMERQIIEFEATVVLATVTTMSQLAERILNAGKTHPSVRLLLFSGEAFYDDQAGLLKAAFPNATVRSVVYGSMDCGIMGLPPKPEHYDNDPRLHQVNSPNVIIEIIDEDGRVITTPGEAGSLVVTNMERRLMPIIRYPSGDRATWVDPALGLFRILDRDRTAIRLGPVSIDFVDLRRIVATVLNDKPVGKIQAVVTRENRKDLLTLNVAYKPATQEESLQLQAGLKRELSVVRPMFREHVEKDLVNELRINFITMQELAVNPRSGKIVEVLDLRSTTV
ncbi:amp-dependent synthetase ligase [Colletotrichum truncatum]|uniref:Amp-dependent synthetase ligase n=1 Tax=Colletotrichum truncatum TaxID=5467 RepID=A0ACC3YR25_COLTU|nr:amp-dependent synthetase ligase [Colletotrichum truncatum]KAF6799092.1 amp-dependent synthetase ligase [Colletotrichum truncatum]